MFKVKYFDTIKPTQFELEFETEDEAIDWVNEEMELWFDLFRKTYPKATVKCINTTSESEKEAKIYILNTMICICCCIVKGE